MKNTSFVNLIDIYNSMVAGSFPLAEGVEPESTVRMLAQEVLHAQNVHMRYSVDDGYVYYLACDSRALSSTPDFSTPLAAGLPGSAGHEGDACYYYSMSPNAAALVRRGQSLKLYVNYSETVLESIASEGLPRIDVTEANSQALESPAWVARVLTNRTANTASKVFLAMTAAAGIVFLGANAVAGYLSQGEGASATRTAEQANAVIKSVSTTHPLAEQMDRIQRLSVETVKAGGWIDGYDFKGGAGERFVISLPSWVTKDVIASLGDGVRTEPQNDTHIWAMKRDLTGAHVKNKGPLPIQEVAQPTPVSSNAIKLAAKEAQ